MITLRPMDHHLYLVTLCALDERGLSQAELARRLGVSQEAIYATLAGRSPMREGTFRRMAVAMGATPRGLLLAWLLTLHPGDEALSAALAKHAAEPAGAGPERGLFAGILRAVRMARGVSRAELAHRAGISPTHGETTVDGTENVLERAAAGLGLDFPELVRVGLTWEPPALDLTELRNRYGERVRGSYGAQRAAASWTGIVESTLSRFNGGGPLGSEDAGLLLDWLDAPDSKPTDQRALRNRLREFLKLGWDLDALAELSPVSRPTLASLVGGKNVRANTARALADWLAKEDLRKPPPVAMLPRRRKTA